MDEHPYYVSKHLHIYISLYIWIARIYKILLVNIGLETLHKNFLTSLPCTIEVFQQIEVSGVMSVPPVIITVIWGFSMKKPSTELGAPPWPSWPSQFAPLILCAILGEAVPRSKGAVLVQDGIPMIVVHLPQLNALLMVYGTYNIAHLTTIHGAYMVYNL